MTRVVAAPDKFKGTIDAPAAAAAIAAGWKRADPGAEIDQVPVADGGDGTLRALVSALGGRTRRVRVTGPLGDPVEAEYGLAGAASGSLGIVEMARASGLDLVPPGRGDPLRATTRGTGELIAAACEGRPARLLVCIGGSATNDAGGGMAQALGIRLLDEFGAELPPGGAALERLARIDASRLLPSLSGVEVVVLTDVDNPLTGAQGASVVYGPQKGATPEDVALLDRALGHFGAVVRRDLGLDVRDAPGAGAAGGLGAGLMAFLGARLRPGFEVVAEVLGLAARLEASDVAVTGEGRYDRQSERGKAPAGVLRLARLAGCRSVLVAGQVDPGVGADADLTISLVERSGLEAALTQTRELLEEAAAEAARAMEGV